MGLGGGRGEIASLAPPKPVIRPRTALAHASHIDHFSGGHDDFSGYVAPPRMRPLSAAGLQMGASAGAKPGSVDSSRASQWSRSVDVFTVA